MLVLAITVPGALATQHGWKLLRWLRVPQFFYCRLNWPPSPLPIPSGATIAPPR
jgi:hypothetical protein